MSSKWPAIAAFLVAAAIILGAFGAHSLKGKLDPYQLSIYEKAVFYHAINALGIFLVALASLLTNNGRPVLEAITAGKICLLLSFGILLFSGSLYLLAITGIKWLGAITPLGGTLFIVSWVWLGLALWRSPG